MFTHDFSPLALAMFLAVGSLAALGRGMRTALALTLALFWMFPLYFLFVKWHCLYLMAIALLVFTGCCLKSGERTAAESKLQNLAAG